MSFFNQNIQLVTEKHRGRLLLMFAVLSGLIPETGSYVTGFTIYCILPTVLGIGIFTCWLTTPLSQKVLLSITTGCGIFILRSFTTWVVIGFNLFSKLVASDWVSRRALLVLLAGQLLFPLIILIPLHFLFSSTKKTKLNDV